MTQTLLSEKWRFNVYFLELKVESAISRIVLSNKLRAESKNQTQWTISTLKMALFHLTKV